MSKHDRGPARFPRLVRKLCIPIAIFWLALAASSNALIPPLEEVGRVHNVAQSAIVEAITAARVKRGDDPASARGIAERLTCRTPGGTCGAARALRCHPPRAGRVSG